MTETRPSTTVNLGAAFRPDGSCYGCNHAEANHRPGGRGICECCAREAVRRAGSGPSSSGVAPWAP